MLLLLKNEMSKISKRKIFFIYLGTLTVILTITGIVVMGLGVDGEMGGFLSQNGVKFKASSDKWDGWEFAASLFSLLFTKAAFLIFEAYLISSIVIDEFKKRTINQLFSYPISKKKIIWSKIIVVILISLICQLAAHFTIQFAIKIITYFNGTQYFFVFNSFLNLFYTTLGIVLIGLFPFVFGMIKYSVVVTILTSLILCSLVSNSMTIISANSFINSLLFIFLISILSLLFVAISINAISKKDVSIH